jgi:predicted nucleic acid-binding protein
LTAAYVDTSCLVAIAFGEKGSAALTKKLSRFEILLSSNLLEAELRSALRREEVNLEPVDLLERISWIHPDRALSAEISRVLDTGDLRGADLWHLAVALFLDPSATELAFLTLDARQQRAASRLGFHLGEQ